MDRPQLPQHACAVAAPMTSTVGSASISSSMASLNVSHIAFSFFAAATATDLRPASGVERMVSLLKDIRFDLAAICGQPRTASPAVLPGGEVWG